MCVCALRLCEKRRLMARGVLFLDPFSDDKNVRFPGVSIDVIDFLVFGMTRVAGRSVGKPGI